MREFPIPLSPRAPILVKLQKMEKQAFLLHCPGKFNDLRDTLRPAAYTCRSLHATPLIQSNGLSPSSAAAKSAPNPASKPLPYKAATKSTSLKTEALNAKQTKGTASGRNIPQPESASLQPVRAWTSFIINVLSRQGDTEAGRKAAEEVVRTGKLPEKYKGASRRHCFGSGSRLSLLPYLYLLFADTSFTNVLCSARTNENPINFRNGPRSPNLNSFSLDSATELRYLYHLECVQLERDSIFHPGTHGRGIKNKIGLRSTLIVGSHGI
ncbi:hypothetical protein EV356DRAFT_376034 [Viridothelium virens]|uniref:Uncharacterized protein n=1 Tax=Viridothelium virens TaxID=1048519 RepID=A0A6A6GWC7_VIRVR|nr:hypothetical protein EV356DRAFT_376034 [Viridothelium virens]